MEKVKYQIFEMKDTHRVRGVKIEGHSGFWNTSQAQRVGNQWTEAGCNWYTQEQIEEILNTKAEVVEEGEGFLRAVDDPDLPGTFHLIGIDENGLEFFIS